MRIFSRGFEWGDGKAGKHSSRMLDCPEVEEGKPMPPGPVKCTYYTPYKPAIPLVCHRLGNPPCYYAGDRPLKELGFNFE